MEKVSSALSRSHPKDRRESVRPVEVFQQTCGECGSGSENRISVTILARRAVRKNSTELPYEAAACSSDLMHIAYEASSFTHRSRHRARLADRCVCRARWVLSAAS